MRRPTPRSRPGPGHEAATEAVADAVAELYRACRLEPPAVLVARDAVHFGRIAARLIRRQDPGVVVLGILLVALVTSTVLTMRGNTLASAYAAALPVLLMPWYRALYSGDHGRRRTASWSLLQVLLPVVLGAILFGLARLGGLAPRSAWLAGSGVIGAVASLQLVLDLLGPVSARRRLLRSGHPGGMASRLLVSLLGAPSAAAVVLARLSSALDEGEEGEAERLRLVGTGGQHRGPAEWAVQEAIREEMRR
jgi:hypothetical protein